MQFKRYKGTVADFLKSRWQQCESKWQDSAENSNQRTMDGVFQRPNNQRKRPRSNRWIPKSAKTNSGIATRRSQWCNQVNERRRSSWLLRITNIFTKTVGNRGKQIIHEPLVQIWNEEKIPKEWELSGKYEKKSDPLLSVDTFEE